jgi:hypothetical protein
MQLRDQSRPCDPSDGSGQPRWRDQTVVEQLPATTLASTRGDGLDRDPKIGSEMTGVRTQTGLAFRVPCAAVLAACAAVGVPTTALAAGTRVFIGTVGEYSPATGTALAQHPRVLQSGGDFLFTSIHWKHWGASVTTASGLYEAAGASGVHVRFVASQPERCGGRMVYTHLSYTGGSSASFKRRYCRFKF